jgi:HK97 family phage portal protein
MNILQRIFGKKASSSVSYATFGNYSDVAEITHYSQALENNSVVSNAVDLVAKACMGTNPTCVDNGKNADVLAKKLLNNPSDMVSGDEFLYKIIEDIYLGGHAFVVFIGNVRSEPLEMYRVDPTKVSTFTNSFNDDDRYQVLNDKYQGLYLKQGERFLNSQNEFLEIIKIQHPSKRSILNSCREEINILAVGLAKNGAMLSNGGRISMLLSFKDYVGQDELADRVNSIERKAREKGGGGFLGIVSGENGVDVKEMGLTPKDMDFIQLQEICRREVYFRCGIPLPLIDSAAATDNNMAAAKMQFYTETVIPLCDLVYSKIGALIAFREKKKYTTLTNQFLIPAVRHQVLGELEKRKKIGIETINEMRSLAGLERIEGGDEVFIEARMVGLGDNQSNLG